MVQSLLFRDDVIPVAAERLAEEWRDVPGFPGYRASSWGRVVTPLGKIAELSAKPGRYIKISMRDGTGTKRSIDLQIVIASAFLGAIPRGMVVHHRNDNKQDNRSENLEIATYSFNAKDKHAKRKAQREQFFDPARD